MTSTYKLNIQKYQLNNGLTILTRPTHNVPSVEIQLWYKVGSKNEKAEQHGMAHFLEHMIFKGSKLLSESDINVLTHKLSGYTNAFTSYDYTAYVFRFPSNAWKNAFVVLAECMQHCKFNEQMISSELKAVIAEMKMYKDDYQSSLIEKIFSTVFEEHPYRHPIIGYKENLWNFNQNDLMKFYKTHYHPENAVLVVVGDIQADAVFKYAKQTFGAIAPKRAMKNFEYFPQNDILSKSISLYRDVVNSWCVYAYKIPGSKYKKNHLSEILSILLTKGKSSRLYEALINKNQLATDVTSINYDLLDEDLFLIGISPKSEESIPRIEQIINEEIEKIIELGIENWEFSCIQKKAEMEYLSLLENLEQQAATIAEFYIATEDENYINKYIEAISKTTIDEIKETLKLYFRSTLQNKGYLLPINQKDEEFLLKIQQNEDLKDIKHLQQRKRISAVEKPKWANLIEIPRPISFSYPKPTIYNLQNGLCLLWYHNYFIPKISLILEFKADYLYEDRQLAGLSLLHSKLLLERTKKHTAQELHKMLESNGILISSNSGTITIEVLKNDLELALKILHEILIEPNFEQASLEKIKTQLIFEVEDYWDNPNYFIDQLAKDTVYKDHPYSKPLIGTIESLERISLEDIQNYHNKFITPQGTNLAIVGDLSQYDRGREIPNLFNKILGSWSGPVVDDLILPTIEDITPTIIKYEINRDQTALGLVAKSIPRTDERYDLLAILDIILSGGPNGSMNSRLFSLREQSGLFYSISGSLVYNAQKGPGMVFIKTLVSNDHLEETELAIKNLLKELKEKGITEEEFRTAKNVLTNAAVTHFESNFDIARSFLFLKKFNFPFDLFDKRGAKLSIIDIGDIHQVAQLFCNPQILSVIKVGRLN